MSSLHEVMQQITKCRKAGEVSYSNFYPGESMDTEYQMTAGEKTVVFLAKKKGVFRVYFHTADLEELKVLLKRDSGACSYRLFVQGRGCTFWGN